MVEYLELCTDRDHCGGLRDEKFKWLMQVCFDEADSFTLSKHIFGDPMYPNYVEDLLLPHLKKTFRTTRWFAYFGGYPLDVLVYEANEETRAIISEYYRDVFLTKNRMPKKKFEQPIGKYLRPSVLEDICFFRCGQMFFGTLSHERICEARCLSARFGAALLSLAPWRETSVDRFGLRGVELQQ